VINTLSYTLGQFSDALENGAQEWEPVYGPPTFLNLLQRYSGKRLVARDGAKHLPVGVFYSGGIFSLITLAKLFVAKQCVHLFTFGNDYTDLPYAWRRAQGGTYGRAHNSVVDLLSAIANDFDIIQNHTDLAQEPNVEPWSSNNKLFPFEILARSLGQHTQPIRYFGHVELPKNSFASDASELISTYTGRQWKV
jgi:hypothetical protein